MKSLVAKLITASGYDSVNHFVGVLTNTLNWGLLPTDNTRSSRSTFA
jgi:hypothetical protein